MTVRLVLAFALLIGLCSVVARGQEIPADMRKQIDAKLIGDWEEETVFDGETTQAYFSWKWSPNNNTILGHSQSSNGVLTQVGHWDPHEKEFVIHGHHSSGDFWTHRYSDLSEGQWAGKAVGSWDGKPWKSEVKVSWPGNDSYVYEDTTEGKPWVSKGKRAQKIDPDKALAAFGNFMKGTWTRTEDDGSTREHTYAWRLDKRFLHTNARKDPIEAWDGVCGVDHRNGKVGWWGFFANGTAGVCHMAKASDDEWLFAGFDAGPDGQFHRLVVVKKLGAGRLRATVTDTLNGEVTVNESVWEQKAAE